MLQQIFIETNILNVTCYTKKWKPLPLKHSKNFLFLYPLDYALPIDRMPPMAGKLQPRLLNQLSLYACMYPNWRRFVSVLWWPARVCWMCWNMAVPVGRNAGWYVTKFKRCRQHFKLIFYYNVFSYFRLFAVLMFLFTNLKKILLNVQSWIWVQLKLSAAKIKQPWLRFQIHSGRLSNIKGTFWRPTVIDLIVFVFISLAL